MKVIRAMSDYIIVMNNGVIVEEGNTDLVFKFPKTSYTKKLLQAVI